MDPAWMVVITVIVFLIVFFVAWGLKVRPLTAVALACVWTLLIQAIMVPSAFTNLQSFEISGWWGALWLLSAAFFIYLLFYVSFMASKDQDHCEKVKVVLVS